MICELLLENGTNPLTESRTGVSPLYIASKNGHKDVVRILLKFGADATRISAEVCCGMCVCDECIHTYRERERERKRCVYVPAMVIKLKSKFVTFCSCCSHCLLRLAT